MDGPDSISPPARILRRARVEAVDLAPELVDMPSRVKGAFREAYVAALLVAGDRPIVSRKDLNVAAGLLRTHMVVVESIDGDDAQVMVRLVPRAGR